MGQGNSGGFNDDLRSSIPPWRGRSWKRRRIAAARRPDGAVIDDAGGDPIHGWRLHDAIRHDAPFYVLRRILRSRPESIRERDDAVGGGGGRLPMHVAADIASRRIGNGGHGDGFIVASWLVRLKVLHYHYPEAMLLPDHSGYLPLHCACSHPTASPIVIRHLADACPNALLTVLDGGGGGTTTTSSRGRRLLPLHVAIRAGANVDAVRCLVNACPRSLHERTGDGLHSLHWAARSNVSFEVANFLVDAGSRALLLERDYRGCLPLHEAAQHASPELVQLYAEQCPQALTIRDHRGWIALHVAAATCRSGGRGDGDGFHSAHQRRLEVVRLLVRLGPATAIDVPDRKGRLPLHVAAAHSDASVDAVRLLADKRPHTLKVQDREGRTPISLAVYYRASVDVVQCLADKSPQALEIKDRIGFLPLHAAARHNASIEVVRCLVNMCPQALQMKDCRGRLPLHIAALYNAALEVVECLVNHCLAALKARDDKGSLPLHVAAAFHRSVDVVRLLADWYPSALQLTKRDEEGLPCTLLPRPIHIAAATNSSKGVVRHLLERYPPALHGAVKRGAGLIMVRCLADRCPESVDVKDRNGRTPVHVAAMHNAPLEVIYFLLRRRPVVLQQRIKPKTHRVRKAADDAVE